MMDLLTHADTAVAVLGGLVALAKVTAWGRANAQALQTVTAVVETLHGTEVKREVARRQEGLPAGAQDVLADAVHTADPKKKPLTPALRLCREVLRGLVRV